jgi:two-component system, cell cycle sensor histidine kinase and response regulator CckA
MNALAKKPLPATTILIVEDERIVARDLQKTLEEMGYRVPKTADSLEAALACAAVDAPDLVLMDIHLRGERDGIDAAYELRLRHDVPVIFLTAYADEETLDRAKRVDAFGYLVKPVKAEELHTTVEVALVRAKNEREQRVRERFIETTLHSIGDGVVSTDIYGAVTFMNPAAEALTGWDAGEAIGQRFGEVIHLVTPGTDIALDPLESRLSAGPTPTREASLRHRDGGERRVADSAAPIVDGRGNVLGGVMVFRDVGIERELRDKLELADRLSSLNTLSAGVAHEINNPLASLCANVGFALDELRSRTDLDDGLKEVMQALDEAEQAGSRVRDIVKDLRAFGDDAKSRNPRVEIQRAVEWACRICRREVQSKATLEVTVDSQAFIEADATRFGQVVVNLLMNAAQAIDKGSPKDNLVSVSVFDDDDNVVLVVRDTGRGIDQKDLGRVFDPFFTTKKVGEGTGLGLSVCHGIVRALGGRMTVQSVVGKGTAFRVSLPRARV